MNFKKIVLLILIVFLVLIFLNFHFKGEEIKKDYFDSIIFDEPVSHNLNLNTGTILFQLGGIFHEKFEENPNLSKKCLLDVSYCINYFDLNTETKNKCITAVNSANFSAQKLKKEFSFFIGLNYFFKEIKLDLLCPKKTIKKQFNYPLMDYNIDANTDFLMEYESQERDPECLEKLDEKEFDLYGLVTGLNDLSYCMNALKDYSNN